MAKNVNADAFIPQIWDAAILRTLEDNLIAKKICTVKPSKAVKGAGDTVYFNGLADPTVTAYTGSVSYESLVSGSIPLKIDQQNYYGFKVTDVEQAMANVDLKGSQASRAAYQLKAVADSYLMGLYTEAAAGTVTDDTCDTATIFGDIAQAARLLEEQNVMEGDGWLVIPPWVKTKLILAGVKFSVNEGINGKGGLSFTDELGLDIYVSNRVYNSGTAAAPVSYCMFGSYNSIVYAETIMKSEMIRLESSFDYGARGLHVFGAKIIKPKEVGYMKLTEVAETTI